MSKHFPLRDVELPASLYIHVPFCVRKCLYCDFVSYPHTGREERAYLDGLQREMALWTGEMTAKRWTMSTVFIGGGTPTCLSPAALLEIISLTKHFFHLAGDVEFTVEANPGTVSLPGLQTLRRVGVNRLSLGAQACDDGTLGILGRIHSHRQTVDAVHWAREAGFDNLNVDLIYGVPGQSLSQWRRCLERVVELQPEHVSAYGLQLETGTPLCTMVDDGRLEPCGEELQLDMYRLAIDLLESAGLRRYEISNFARPGRRCRHNLVYWHNGQYLGLGPAAHSRLGPWRLANQKGLAQYLAALEGGELPVVEVEELRPQDEIFETVFLGLRLARGLDLNLFRTRYGRALDEVYPGVAERLTARGLVEISGNCLRLTSRGLAVANSVMAEFAPV